MQNGPVKCEQIQYKMDLEPWALLIEQKKFKRPPKYACHRSIWNPDSGCPQNILWMPSGLPLDILWAFSRHSLYFFFIKKSNAVVLFFHSHSSFVWMFLVSWYHLSAQQHHRSESLWFLPMPMYALSIHPQSILWRSFGPLWMPSGILWISSGHPLDIL